MSHGGGGVRKLTKSVSCYLNNYIINVSRRVLFLYWGKTSPTSAILQYFTVLKYCQTQQICFIPIRQLALAALEKYVL